jgi:hypothetical protein
LMGIETRRQRNTARDTFWRVRESIREQAAASGQGIEIGGAGPSPHTPQCVGAELVGQNEEDIWSHAVARMLPASGPRTINDAPADAYVALKIKQDQSLIGLSKREKSSSLDAAESGPYRL